MSSVYDASVILAALAHVNGELINVNVYIFHVQNEKKTKTENGTDRKDSASQTKVPLKLGQGKILS